MLNKIAKEIEVKLAGRLEVLTANRVKLLEDKVDCLEQYQLANTGDRAENAPLEAAIRRMKEINSAILTNELQITQLADIQDLSKYNSVGIVVMYSTVKLENSIKGELIYRIYPKDVSFVDIGVIASNSRLATAIMGRQVGDVVSIEHTSNGDSIRYTIKDIY